MAKLPKIFFIYTGGTVGMIKDPITKVLKPFNFEQLLNKLPELKGLNCEIDSYSVENPIDSSDMDASHWIGIAEIIEKNYEKYDGFVVLHGTDTIAFTSSALSFMFQNLTKPVIFTGAQLPIGDIRTDAKENIITSIEIACTKNEDGDPIVSEVCLYFKHKLFRANRTTKYASAAFNAYRSPNLELLGESGVHLDLNQKLLIKKDVGQPFSVFKSLEKNVGVIKLFPGIVEEYVRRILEIPNLKGVILETFGPGNANTQPWFLNLIKNAIEKGIHVINLSQCTKGYVDMGKYETSVALKEMGVTSGKDLTFEAALTKMMYLLGKNLSKEEFQRQYVSSLRGELSK